METPTEARSGLEPTGSELGELVDKARRGDRRALEGALIAVRDDVYGLAMRMLWHPDDAEDATQEILIKVMVRLDGFRGEAAFRTWVYRIAANHLLTTRRRRSERQALSFDEFAADLAIGLDRTAADRDTPDRIALHTSWARCSGSPASVAPRSVRSAPRPTGNASPGHAAVYEHS